MCSELYMLILYFASVCVVGKERESEEDQENVHPQGNVLETALLVENVLQDGHAELSQDILYSSPNSLSMGKLIVLEEVSWQISWDAN